jgi:putative endopeptidase
MYSLVNLDTTVTPGDDIFMHANGGWIKNKPYSFRRKPMAVSANLVIEENTRRLREISESAAKENDCKRYRISKDWRLLAHAMDTIKIEAEGIKPIQPYLDKIAAITI